MNALRLYPLSLLLLAAPAAAQQCSMFAVTPSGENLNMTDDSVATRNLGFAFPFNSQSYNSISIGSNGYVWLGANAGIDFSDTEAEFLSQGPRIAVCWDDWNPGAGGSVTFATTATQASVTWHNVPRFGNAAVLANMELVIDVTGQINLYYDTTMGVTADACIVGISAGNNALPAAISWSTPPALITAATGYELFAASGFNLTGQTINLIPVSATDYVVTNSPLPTCPTNIGVGCPTELHSAYYEFFPGSTVDLSNTSLHFLATGSGQYVLIAGPGIDTSYTPADIQVQGDDTIVTGLPVGAMGSFPFAGATYSSMSVSSNGSVWMGTSTVTTFTTTIANFLTQGPRVSVYADWNFSTVIQGGGGTCYWTTGPNFCMATYENVAAYGQAGSQNTFQIKLLASGDVIISFGTILNNSTTNNAGDLIVGLTDGVAATDPGSVDLSSQVGLSPAVLISRSSLTHRVDGPPRIGNPYVLRASGIPSGSGLGVFILGTQQLNLDLSPLGMTGCSQYASNNATSIVLLIGNPTTMSYSLALPPNPRFVGANLFTQAASFSPGVNAFGVATSNGVHGVVGS